MVIQYPDKLFFISGETDSVHDEETGRWIPGSKGIVFSMVCRYEVSGVAKEIQMIQSQTAAFDFVAYMPLGNLELATKFIVDDKGNFIVDRKTAFVVDNQMRYVVNDEGHFLVDDQGRYLVDNQQRFVVDEQGRFLQVQGRRLSLFIKEFLNGLQDSVQVKCVNRLNDVLGFGVVNRFSLGQLNCRAWITLSNEKYSKLDDNAKVHN